MDNIYTQYTIEIDFYLARMLYKYLKHKQYYTPCSLRRKIISAALYDPYRVEVLRVFYLFERASSTNFITSMPKTQNSAR